MMSKTTPSSNDDVRAQPAAAAKLDAPILQSLRGLLKQGGLDGYRQHLAAKYR